MISPELKERIHNIIFEADTRGGKLFDIILLLLIFFSIVAVSVETVPGVSEKYGQLLITLEWIFTILFTIEYIFRLYTVKRPLAYATSFYGLVDLFSVLPTYLSFFVISGTHSLMMIRALRLLRVFRIFKMGHALNQGNLIIAAVRASATKISVFLYFILVIVCIFGAVMYLVEGGVENTGFDSIPRSIYWSIVTITTVGYGDISPQTSLGQFLSAILMVLGYAVIAVPTGLISSEFIRQAKSEEEISTQHCANCSREGHDTDAEYCKYCGELLHEHSR